MNWLVIALLAYFVLALVGVVDKFLLSKIIKDNRIYVFLIGVLGIFVFGAAPFVEFSYPGLQGLFIDIFSGIFLISALFLFYRALQDGEASIVIPLIGGGMPVLVFIFAVLFLGESFNRTQTIAVVLLLLGGILMTLIPKEKPHWWEWQKKKKSGLGTALLSTLLFAGYFILSDYIYQTQGFANGFIWSRIGSFAGIIWLLFDKSFRKNLKIFLNGFFKKRGYLFFVNQTFGGIAFLGQGYAISLQGAAVVNALQGVQYVFLLGIASFFSIFFPKAVHERFSVIIIVEKLVAISLIGIGVFVITQQV